MISYFIRILLLLSICYQCRASVVRESHEFHTHMHPSPSDGDKRSRVKREDTSEEEEFHNDGYESTSEFWRSEAQKKLREQLRKKVNRNIAKNVILFLGDGMSLSTITAARIYFGQKLGYSGEESILSFEEFPHIGFSKVRSFNSERLFIFASRLIHLSTDLLLRQANG